MDITIGVLTSLFNGLNAKLLKAIREAKIPEAVGDFVMEVPSTTGTEEYPTAAMLGDLEEALDELPFGNLGEFMQSIRNKEFHKGLEIPRSHIADDRIGMYSGSVAQLGRKAATFPYRYVPLLFIRGFAQAWIDGANVFSNTHVWPGGITWDNLDNFPLTATTFEWVCQNLMNRLDPDGVPMELTPTHLIVGPANWNNARRIINRELVGGGNSNIHLDEVKVVKWSRLRGTYAYYWFVVDASEERPVIIQNREGPEFTGTTSPEDESMHRHNRAEYKVYRRFGTAIALPWLIQAVCATEDSTTTTAG